MTKQGHGGVKLSADVYMIVQFSWPISRPRLDSTRTTSLLRWQSSARSTDTISSSDCNFQTAFIRCDLLTLAYDRLTLLAYMTVIYILTKSQACVTTLPYGGDALQLGREQRQVWFLSRVGGR